MSDRWSNSGLVSADLPETGRSEIAKNPRLPRRDGSLQPVQGSILYLQRPTGNKCHFNSFTWIIYHPESSFCFRKGIYKNISLHTFKVLPNTLCIISLLESTNKIIFFTTVTQRFVS